MPLTVAALTLHFIAPPPISPTITTTLFRVPQCKDINYHSFHEDDFNIDCSSGSFYTVTGVAVLLILIVPVGVPVGFLFFMNRAKATLGGVNMTVLGGAKLSSDAVDDEDDK